MKKVLVMMVVLAATAFAQEATQQQTPPAGAPPQAQPAQAQPVQAQPQQKKEIKDQAEYSAYMAALNQTQPAARAAAFDAFLQQYPNSVMKPEALEYMMAGYNEAGNPQKTIEAATRLLEVEPNNLAALGILADYERKMAQSGQNPQQNLALAQQHAEAGLKAMETQPKPAGMSDADYEKLRTQLTGIFNGALGINSLQNKDFPKAQTELRAAVNVSPSDYSLVYPLALAYLQAPQPDYINGLFFIARAAALAPAQVQNQMAQYGKSQYVKYHGGGDGWDQLLATAKTATLPPADFTIKPAPTPAEQAHTMLQNTPVNQMNYADFELILSAGTPEDQQALWNQIKGKAIRMEGFLLSATPTKLMIAGTVDANTAKRPDLELDMAAPIPRTVLATLKPGQTIQFEGTPASYTNAQTPAAAGPASATGAAPAPGAQQPAAPAANLTAGFLMVMDHGTLFVKTPTRVPAKPPARRRPPAR